MSVFETLVEHTKAITNSIAGNRQTQGSAAIEKTCRQSTKPTIAQPGILLLLVQVLQLHTQAMKCLIGLFGNAQTQKCIPQQAPHQKFQ